MATETLPPPTGESLRTHVADLHHAMDMGWIVPGQFVLDLGCGLSRDLAYLAEHGVHACGIDVSAAARIQSSDQRAPQVLQADVLHLPFAPERFDVLLDRGCFRHIPAAARPAYATELQRVLRPSGQLLLFRASDDQELDPAELQHSFAAWQVFPLDPEVGYALSPHGRRPHVYGPSRREGSRAPAP